GRRLLRWTGTRTGHPASIPWHSMLRLPLRGLVFQQEQAAPPTGRLQGGKPYGGSVAQVRGLRGDRLPRGVRAEPDRVPPVRLPHGVADPGAPRAVARPGYLY